MPNRIALVTALIVERPMCIACVGAKAGVDSDGVTRTLERTSTVLVVARDPAGRCRACGLTGPVVSIVRPGN